MSEEKALKILEEMPEEKFQEFYNSLPYRVRLCCEGGLVDWREVLPQWFQVYVKLTAQAVRES